MKLVFVDAKHLSVGQKQRIVELQSECFSHVSRKEIEECFFAKGFGWVFAYDDDVIIGQAELYSRRTRFEEKTISLGGIGGTCVSIDSRRNGIGKELVKMGLRILREKKSCEIACLSADVRNQPEGGLYHELGFKLMTREISFEDVNGRIRHDKGEMFIPLRSEETFNLVMNSTKTLHLGQGYW